MLPPNNFGPDESGVSVNETLFRGMIGSLMYLTASRPDIQFSTCLYARYQANPKESHLVDVKRIFRYLKETPNLGLWYPKGSGFDLKAYSDSDYAGCNLDRKIPSWVVRYLAENLINKLQNGKKPRETNICYTRYISLVLEQLLGDNYHDESLTVLKPHHVSAISFQTPSASEVSLTSHMLKVAKLSKEPEQSLLPPFGEVNANDTTDKSLSKTFVQPVTQSKAPTAKKPKKKKIPSLTQPKVSNDSREMNPPSTATHLQATEEFVVTVVPLQSLEASISAEVPEKVVEFKESAEEQSLEIPTVEQLLDEVDNQNIGVQETSESPYDIKSEIKGSDSDLQSMPDDELRSVSGFETAESDGLLDNEVSTSNHIVQDDNASAERLSLPDHMDHICEEVSSFHSKLGDIESSIVEIKSSLPTLVTNALKEQLPELLSATLKDSLPSII
ncbi:hypothetical protein Tco_0394643 [Tanacetum coccineum]